MHTPPKGVNSDIAICLEWLMKPSNVILMGGKKRTGKSHILIFLTWYAVAVLNCEVLTNMVFKRRLPDGDPSGKKFILEYPPGVTYCNTLLDVMLHTVRIMNTSDKNVIVVMDELQNFMSAYEWNSPLGKDFVIFLGIISKLRQTYILATPDIKMFPRGIRDPDADVATALMYKDIEHTYDFNSKAGTMYTSKEIIFLERPGCKKEIWEVGMCPWTLPEDQVPIGQIVYDHLVPGSRFSLGTLGDYTFDFRDVVAKVEHVTSEDIPGKLIEYVREIRAYERYLNLRSTSRQNTAVASAGEQIANDQVRQEATDAREAQTNPENATSEVREGWPTIHQINKDEELKKEIEKNIILPYLGAFTDIKPAELLDRGLVYGESGIYRSLRKAKKEKADEDKEEEVEDEEEE
jgi:hypothetical protein